MSAFQSINLPVLEDKKAEAEIRKMGLDILAKLNSVANSIPMGIYDSGSNTNGSWIRFTDGTMQCRGSLSTAMTGAAGSTPLQTITFPVSFIDTSYVVQASTLTAANLASFWEFYTKTVSSITTTGWIRDAVVSTTAVTCMWIATGTWK